MATAVPWIRGLEDDPCIIERAHCIKTPHSNLRRMLGALGSRRRARPAIAPMLCQAPRGTCGVEAKSTYRQGLNAASRHRKVPRAQAKSTSPRSCAPCTTPGHTGEYLDRASRGAIISTLDRTKVTQHRVRQRRVPVGGCSKVNQYTAR